MKLERYCLAVHSRGTLSEAEQELCITATGGRYLRDVEKLETSQKLIPMSSQLW